VRRLWALLVLVCLCGMAASGCGEPKPIDSSKFDQAAYDDVDAASKGIKEDKAMPPQ